MYALSPSFPNEIVTLLIFLTGPLLVDSLEDLCDDETSAILLEVSVLSLGVDPPQPANKAVKARIVIPKESCFFIIMSPFFK